MSGTPRRVTAGDGVSLAVHDYGDEANPTIVAVHGYPDNHGVWDGVAAELAADFHVVAYDVRGAGDSDQPGARSAYRLPRLAADLMAVIDAVSPDAPVYVLAHDWGSIQAWDAVLDEHTGRRIAAFVSISGPSLDHAGVWLRDGWRHPRAALAQTAHSYYLLLFQLPRLPELAARRGVIDRLVRTRVAARSSLARAATGPRPQPDLVNGLELYRANLLPSLGRPGPRRTSIPVLLIVPERDAYVTPGLAIGATERWVDNLTVERVSGGHWIVSERPEVVARLVRTFLSSLGSPAGRKPSAGDPHARGRFTGRLVVVTGGARGIGRSSALEFARQGADVLIADIDDAAAKQTVDDVRTLGVQAWSRHLDVGDAEAWEAFAADVPAEHGVPDIVMNNAGIGMGGPFLATSVDDWRRVIDVNVWSVIHGCRLFARQMAERGQGGHIVNVASAAAYSPSVVYPAYATSKAAVLMLSECLRAELEREGIGVTAVCPGFIDTDISRTTVHVGVDDETALRLTKHQVASYHRRGYSPDKVARQVVRAVAANAPIAVITPEARVLRAISRFAPALGRRVAKLDLTKL